MNGSSLSGVRKWTGPLAAVFRLPNALARSTLGATLAATKRGLAHSSRSSVRLTDICGSVPRSRATVIVRSELQNGPVDPSLCPLVTRYEL